MRCKWKECTLGDLITFQRGHDLPKNQMTDGKYPVVGSNGIIGYHNEYTTESPSITIGRSGNVGNPFIVYGRTWSHNTTLYVKDFKGNDPVFVFYFLKTLDLVNYAGGSAVPTLNRNHIHTLPIKVPESAEIQKKIGYYLRLLDEKIAINREINENLERQISEIYRVWYQKYVCAVGLPLVESEYGLIPQGWHYSLVGELCKSISISHKFDAEKLIFLNTGDIEDGRFLHANYMAVSDMPGQAKKTILPGDILYSEIRPINKHYAYVTFPSEDYVVSTKLMVIRASGIDSRRLYHYLTTEDVITKLQMEAESRSGTFPQIRFDNISKLPILIADDVTEAAFTTLLHTVYDQIEHNNSENEKLASLRDSLLPRLISGEIDVSAVQL